MTQEPEQTPSIEALSDKLRAFDEKDKSTHMPNDSGMHNALRSGLELLSGVLVGTLSGVLLDRWLATSPLFLIVCFMLGAAGGFLTIVKSTTRS